MHYLDYAATSAIRPEAVAAAVHHFLTDVGASPGRGGHQRSIESGRIAFRCRRRLARVMGLPGSPGQITFMLNATHALNTAIHGVTRTGDAVVISPFDHNAVLRPVHALTRTRDVGVRMLEAAGDGSFDLDAAGTMLEGARLLVVNAISNVLGSRLPLAELSKLARERGVLVLVDAAQSAGHLTGHPGDCEVDLVAFTGHKGLLGPQGTGGLWVREGVEVEPFCTGGTGGDSALREMPPVYPDHLEAGTPNAPGLAGLLAGCDFVLERGIEALHAEECRLKARLREGLDSVRGVRVVSPPDPKGGAVVTVVADALTPSELADELEKGWDVLCRPGLHCAPEAHRLLGTLETGALRFSLGWDSTDADVDRAVEGVDAILSRTVVTAPGHV
ncbi:MAG: aminotransferase class V-fold PLP-dependent enzyme [Gemmatimonadales bacterium]|nr:MAG: aminotransferase class V-fold PLP-dependent enzyme [Gemmatimonadales bacterium]